MTENHENETMLDDVNDELNELILQQTTVIDEIKDVVTNVQDTVSDIQDIANDVQDTVNDKQDTANAMKRSIDNMEDEVNHIKANMKKLKKRSKMDREDRDVHYSLCNKIIHDMQNPTLFFDDNNLQ